MTRYPHGRGGRAPRSAAGNQQMIHGAAPRRDENSENQNIIGGVAGGERTGSMTRISTHPTMTVHQHNAVSLAERRLEFVQLVAAIAQQLAPFAITKEEKQAVWDAQRPACPRLSIRSLELLCDLAARSDHPFLLEEAMRGAVIQRLAAPTTLCPIDTFLDETRAQAKADVAQAMFLVERTPTRRDQALDGLGVHRHWLSRSMDALHAWPSPRKVFG